MDTPTAMPIVAVWERPLEVDAGGGAAIDGSVGGYAVDEAAGIATMVGSVILSNLA